MKLSINDVSKKYDKIVLDHMKLELEGYSTIAIIGKSGCGKSTLLRLLTGIEAPDHGTMHVNGHEVGGKRKRSYQDKISVVFQQHNLFPHLTILENITLILEKIRGISGDKARARAMGLLTGLHLEDELNKKPKSISGGQAQRASIARALATDPEVVFMDEPTAALDPILTKEVLDAVLELKASGTKFVFVTHEINFVRRFAEYVLFMDEGKVIEQGKVDILDHPETTKLQLFLENEG